MDSHGKPQGEWSTGFFDCFSDCENCCMTIFCSCVTFGKVAEIVDQGSTSCCIAGTCYLLLNVIMCGRVYSCYYRNKMRDQYNLIGSNGGDCCKHICCEPCALTQLYRELKHRGFDMSLGWEGNAAKQGGGVMGAPVSQGGMKR